MYWLDELSDRVILDFTAMFVYRLDHICIIASHYLCGIFQLFIQTLLQMVFETIIVRTLG